MPSSPFPASHDALFKALLDEPRHAAALVRDHLPVSIIGLIDESALPEPLADSFVDPELRESRSDRLYRINLKSGLPGYIYALFEHKSWPDPRIFEQLLRYQLEIWARHAYLDGEGKLAYPLVIPLVVYHGERPWNVPQSVGEMIARDGIDQPYGLLSYRYCLLDLGAMPYNELSSEPVLWAGFAALRGAFRPEEGEANLAAILQKLPDGSVLEKQVAAYIIGKWNIRPRELRAALIEAKPERGEANMGLLAEELKAEGVAGMLKRLLQQRFGPLPESAQSRIEDASLEDLEAWGERILNASSLEAVFGGGAVRHH